MKNNPEATIRMMMMMLWKQRNDDSDHGVPGEQRIARLQRHLRYVSEIGVGRLILPVSLWFEFFLLLLFLSYIPLRGWLVASLVDVYLCWVSAWLFLSLQLRFSYNYKLTL